MNLKKNYGKNLLEEIDFTRLPAHIAIIMDGNGRWAEKNRLHRVEGHRKGVEVTREIIEAASDLGIRVLTLYAFSTENWKRPKREVFALMQLLKHYLGKEIGNLHDRNVRVRAVGDLDRIPPGAKKVILRSVEKTRGNSGLTLNLAVNYGARAEIIDGIRKILKDAEEGRMKTEEITQETFERYLSTAGLPDPDLLIRTGNEMRISNFLLWQIAYTEFWVSPLFWPEFTKQDFYTAISDYQKRSRRFGAVN